MSVLRPCLTMALAGSLLLGGTVAAIEPEASTAESDHAPAAPEKVLFIGNSHTARNGGLDWLVTNMVASVDPDRPFDATIRTADGVNLEYHYRNSAPQAIRAGGYDAVVLQDYIPGSPDRSTDAFIEYGGKLGREVQAAGARPVLYMTWPQVGRGWATLDDFLEAHRVVASELGAEVAPVGLAFAMAGSERPDLVLVSDDGIHATWEGAYLAAVTVYATLFGSNPEGLGFSFGVDPEDAAFLQSIAWQALTEWDAAAA